MDEALTAQTRTLYDTVADDYARIVSGIGFESGVDLAMVDDFVRQLGDTGDLAVLDAGCGTGRMIGYLQHLNSAITPVGVDLSPGMLRHAREANQGVDFLEGELAALPFAEQQFHGVLAWYSIIHTPPHELPGVFAEFHRVLRPGGLVLLGYQAGAGDRRLSSAYGHEVDFHAFLHATPDVEDALRAAAFTVDARLDRGPRHTERHAQGFVLARRADR